MELMGPSAIRFHSAYVIMVYDNDFPSSLERFVLRGAAGKRSVGKANSNFVGFTNWVPVVCYRIPAAHPVASYQSFFAAVRFPCSTLQKPEA